MNSLTVQREYGFCVSEQFPENKYDAIILAVSHSEFIDLDVSHLKNEKCVVYDVKAFLNKKIIDGRL